MTYRQLAAIIADMDETQLDQTVFVEHPEIKCFMEVEAWTSEDCVSDGEEVIIKEDGRYLAMVDSK